VHHASTRARKAVLTRREQAAHTLGQSSGQGGAPRKGTTAARAEAALRRGRGLRARGPGRGAAPAEGARWGRGAVLGGRARRAEGHRG
jgi:hypothetical protein